MPKMTTGPASPPNRLLPALRRVVLVRETAERTDGQLLTAFVHDRDGDAFAALVRDSFARMAAEGTLNRLYTEWLVDRLPNGERLNVPMSPALAEMYRALGQQD